MVAEARPLDGTETAALTTVASPLSMSSVQTLRKWVPRTQIDSGERPEVTSEEHAEIKRLRRENEELRRANEILKSGSAFFAAAELDRRFRQ